MVDERIVTWLELQLEAGQDATELHRLLVLKGFSETDVLEAIHLARQRIEAELEQQKKIGKELHSQTHHHIAIALGTLSIALGTLAILFFFFGPYISFGMATNQPTALVLGDERIDCLRSQTCFAEAFTQCLPATVVEKTNTCTIQTNIKLKENNICILEHTAYQCKQTSTNTKNMICSYPMDVSYTKVKEQYKTYCIGSLQQEQIYFNN